MKRPGFYFTEDKDVVEANSAWLLEDIESFAQYLKDNVDPDTVVEFTYKEFSEDEWKRCCLVGKMYDGEELSKEEEDWLDNYDKLNP